MWEQLEENDDATLERHCEMWERKTGVRVSISDDEPGEYERAGRTYKKRRWAATERNEEKRSAFRERLKRRRSEATPYSWTSPRPTSPWCPRYGGAPKGERAHGQGA